MEVTEFIDNDVGFFNWMRQNPNGFFINAQRNIKPKDMVLHRSGCQHIRYTKGAPRSVNEFTKAYRKICALSIEALRDWAKNHGRPDGSFSNECKNCAEKLSESGKMKIQDSMGTAKLEQVRNHIGAAALEHIYDY
jgi:hypothetical protein